jgi:hypothetical protein
MSYPPCLSYRDTTDFEVLMTQFSPVSCGSPLSGSYILIKTRKKRKEKKEEKRYGSVGLKIKMPLCF